MHTYTLTDGASLHVRLAHPDDAQDIITYLNTISFQTDQLSFSGYSFSMTADQERTYLERIAADATHDRVITGWVDGDLISVTNIAVKTAPRRQHIAEINMSVMPPYHGRGVGSHMLSYTIDVAREQGIGLLMLWVRVDNRRAISLYHKCGFRVVGMLPHGDRYGDIYHDVYMMYTNLSI